MKENKGYLHKNLKEIISFLSILIWMIIIFFMSSMSSLDSNYKSKKIIAKVVDSTQTINVEKKNSNQQNQLVNDLNKPLRNLAHAFFYLILGILIINYQFLNDKCQSSKVFIAVFLCFLYACTDEFHQLFVVGRTGQFSDVMIDTFGATVGCLIYYQFFKNHKKAANILK